MADTRERCIFTSDQVLRGRRGPGECICGGVCIVLFSCFVQLEAD